MNEEKKKKAWLIPLLICVLIGAGAAAYLIGDSIRTKKEYEEYLRLQAATAPVPTMEAFVPSPTPTPLPAAEEEGTPTPTPMPVLDVEIPEKEIDWDELHETNEDIYAWIYVPDISVDYPVVQHPSNDAFYLNHNLDGSYGGPACIFSEKTYNSTDFTDPNTVLYGHNYDNRTMFSSLHDFEKDSFMQEDHYIFIYREEGEPLVYQVFAAYERNAWHLLDGYDLSNTYSYAQYLREIYEPDGRISNYREDIIPASRDRIITLSTCTKDHLKRYRYLVQGVLLNPWVNESAPDIRL